MLLFVMPHMSVVTLCILVCFCVNFFCLVFARVFALCSEEVLTTGRRSR